MIITIHKLTSILEFNNTVLEGNEASNPIRLSQEKDSLMVILPSYIILLLQTSIVLFTVLTRHTALFVQVVESLALQLYK